jgi:hypothetical protein
MFILFFNLIKSLLIQNSDTLNNYLCSKFVDVVVVIVMSGLLYLYDVGKLTVIGVQSFEYYCYDDCFS